MRPIVCGVAALAFAGSFGSCAAVPLPWTTLASGLDNPSGIAVDSKNVYWTNSGDCTTATGSVMMCAVGGCNGQPTVLAQRLVCPWALAVDATTVYWTSLGSSADQPESGPPRDIGSVMACAIAGCNDAPTTLVLGIYDPQGIAVDSVNVYWTDPLAKAVSKCATAGCGKGPTQLASGLSDPQGIAVDATSVYFADGAVMKVPIDGGGPPTALACSDATDVAVQGASVYCLGSDSSSAVSEAPSTPGGTATTLWASSGGVSPVALAVDATAVYFTGSDGAVRKVPIGGGAVSTLVVGSSDPGLVAVDSENVYWTTPTAVLTTPK